MKNSFLGLTYPKGFRIAVNHVPIKKRGPDIFLLVSDKKAIYSSVFTKNRLKAFCVKRGIELFDKNKNHLKALLVNSGNANAVTGKQGEKDTLILCERLAFLLKVDSCFVLNCSTGIIGESLPIGAMKEVIGHLCKDLSLKDLGSDSAILTTDTRVKSYSLSFALNGQEVRLSGIAKGSGMIHPQMATMLAFFTTDCVIDQKILKEIFFCCVEKSFHAITVDGDQSTNDTALIWASCSAKNSKIVSKEGAEAQIFKKHLMTMMQMLAKDIVSDGEGATKLVEILVEQANSTEEAKQGAMAVARSCLVKTAIFGEDPNWGRIMAALGSSGIDIDAQKIELFLQGEKIFSGGEVQSQEKKVWRELMKEKIIQIKLILHQKKASFTVWTSDLSYDYIKINAKYHT